MRESPFEVKPIPESDVHLVVAAMMAAKDAEWGGNEKYLPKPNPITMAKVLGECAKNNTLIGYFNNNILCGFLAVTIDRFWWSDEDVLMDVVLYIKPEFRSYSAFNRLLSVAEEFARLNKVPMALSFFSSKDLARKGRTIIRRGYKPISWLMFKRFN